MRKSHIYVNGPVNTVRLEGSVGSNNKVTYLFMDFHAPAYMQEKCSDIRATDISTFLVEEFDKLNKSDPNMMFDFMFERGPTRPHHIKNKKEIYLTEIADLFTKAFKLDVETNKALKSDLVPNVRFHYVDVRDFLLRTIFTTHFRQISPLLNTIYHHETYNPRQLGELFSNIQAVQSEVATLYVSLYQTHNLFNPKIEKSLYSANISKVYDISEKDNYKLVQQLIYKLLTKYNNKSVQKLITEIINTELYEMFMDFFNYINSVLSFITEEIDFFEKLGDHSPTEILFQQLDGTYTYGPDLTTHWKNLLRFHDINSKLSTKLIDIGLYLMDLYNLRRILDKSYVTHALAYTGARHSTNYVRLLIKYFGFKLTNYSYLKNDNIKEAEKMIKASKTVGELDILFYPFVFTQCSDLGSFPKLFT
jgi:hypothetical protein